MSGTTSFIVATDSELDAAIAAIDIGGTASAIDLASGGTLTVQGNSSSSTRAPRITGRSTRGFVVNSGSVAFDTLSLTGLTEPSGGPGGGAIYVGAGASVSTSGVSFNSDTVKGGSAQVGAVFVAQGGTLDLGGTLIGRAGAAGNDIFIQGNNSITLDNARIIGVTADKTGTGSGSGAGSVVAEGSVILARTNQYTGGTEIDGAPTLTALGAGAVPVNQIDGLIAGSADTIGLQGVGLATGSTLSPGNQLTLHGGSGVATLNLDPIQDHSADTFFLASDGGTGTDVAVLQTTFLVGSEAALNAALAQIDVGDRAAAPSVAYSITFTANIALTTELYAINLASFGSLTVDGAGFTLYGGGIQRGFFDYAGSLFLNNLTIADAVAAGGAGGAGALGGGGGAGLGGGLFVAAGAAASLSDVVFRNDQAIGGAGGAAGPGEGGGGGLGGDGGAGGNNYGGGGGGIGNLATGGSEAGSKAGGPGIVLGAAGGNAGRGDSPTGGAGGANGGGGGEAGEFVLTGTGGGTFSFVGIGGSGGVGGNFGGGAGSPGTGAGVAAGFGGGGSASPGGWGGGGGSANAGGFGGGSNIGGGLGAGGAVFVQAGGALTITGGSVFGGAVRGGAGSNGGSSGSALGSGVFDQGGTIALLAAAGQVLTIADAIADGGGSLGLLLDGAGSVLLSGANSFTGGVFVDSGTLSLQSATASGTGPITFASGATADLVIGNGDKPAGVISGFLPGITIDLQGIGTATVALLGTDDVLHVLGGREAVRLPLDPTQPYNGETFAVTGDGSGGTLLTAGTNDALTVNDASNGNIFALTDSTNAGIMLHGSDGMVFLNGGSAGVTDLGAGLTPIVGPQAASVTVQNLTSDSTAVIDLAGGVGGYRSVPTVLAALNSDGSGGTVLPPTSGGLDFLSGSIGGQAEKGLLF